MSELPTDVSEEAERLTRLAREAVDEDEAAAYRRRRASLLDNHEFTARIREDETGDVLVLHPEEWIEDGRIHPDRIEDTDRATEISLEGPGDPDEWDDVRDHNEAIAEQVRDAHGDVHGDNAAAFADFMQNHLAKPVESATGEEIQTFLSEYFPRNAWPSETQQAEIDRSIELVFETADARLPEF
ncbi:hypothetical protein SAMN06269185_2007 [Natronoarchaeum philippinense]|uniref:RnhA operon protein n=1 Tax=Natronoarchaeum philippinense TaxID=558529 RepID=A0A285NU25_NATPI|nr:rnhA operon protein [Natronoarchaeum philippinense]SNZ12994.1 hypothetical protein SAMN06269185_2007 [Natronoarchaeum philippinense]